MPDFGHSFNFAWEKMVQVLFRPFRLEKWLGMGLSAFLAGLLVGGNGINNFQIPDFSQFKHHQQQTTLSQPRTAHTVFISDSASFLHLVDDEEGTATMPLLNFFSGLGVGVIIHLGISFFFFILLIQVLLVWLGTRGQFMFLDNIVRNRSAITQPWERYAPQAHSLFKLYLLYLAGGVVVTLMLLVPLGFLLWPVLFYHATALAIPALLGLMALILIMFLLLMPIAFIFFNFTEFGIPIMFRNGTEAAPALRQVLRLIQRHFGSLVLYALIRFGLWMGLVICGLLLCCVCCIGIIPYVGTVALLPGLVFIRAFSLHVLTQLEPELDVFTVDGAVPLG